MFAHCVIDSAVIGADCNIGPFARFRPSSTLAAGVHIGNFVEVKNSQLAEGSKANHLSYVGDAQVGARVNLGAGTIIANYDGAHKHRTLIEDDVHTGSNSVLVAPITVGAGATIAAGSTVVAFGAGRQAHRGARAAGHGRGLAAAAEAEEIASGRAAPGAPTRWLAAPACCERTKMMPAAVSRWPWRDGRPGRGDASHLDSSSPRSPRRRRRGYTVPALRPVSRESP